MTQPSILSHRSPVCSGLWHRGNLTSQVPRGWSWSKGNHSCSSVHKRLSLALALPPLQWGDGIQVRVALFHFCSHIGHHTYTLAPASPPLANIQYCIPQG